MKTWLLSFTFLMIVHFPSSAEDATTEKLRVQVANSETLVALNKNLMLEELYSMSLLSCEFELKSDLPPINCYPMLMIQLQNKYITQKQWMSKIRQLDFQCQKSVEKITDQLLLQQKLRSNDKSALNCRESIEKRSSDLIYQQEESITGILDEFQDKRPIPNE